MAANKKKKSSAKIKTLKKTLKKKAAPKGVAAKKTASAKKAAPKKAAPKKSVSKKTTTAKTKNKLAPKVATKLQTKLTSTTSKTQLNYSKVFSPLDDRILVDALPAETVTPGGLIIPDSAQEQQGRGLVIAVGPGKRNKKAQLRPLDVQLGDKIIYAKFSGTPIEIHGKEVLILREDEVLGILNK